MTQTFRSNLSLIVKDLYLRDLEETNVNIHDYIAEEAQHVTHHDFLHQDHLLRLLPIELEMTLRHHIPQDHLAYDYRVIVANIYLILLGHLLTKDEE